MKKVFLTGLMFMAVVFIVLFSSAVQAAEKANLLLNPGFEDNDGQWWGNVDDWEKGGNTEWVGTISANSCEESWSFSIGNDRGKRGASGYCLQVLCNPANPNNLYPVTPGDVVTFNMWMAGETNHTGKALLKIEFYGYDRRNGYSKPPLKTFTSTSHTGAFDYLQETVTGAVPKGTISIAVVCSSEGMEIGSGNSLVSFDNGGITVQPF